MKILVAPDKFKGSLEAEEVCAAIRAGIFHFDPAIEVICFPLADGGDGTARILTQHAGGEMKAYTVQDPLCRPVQAQMGLSADRRTAFIEMAQASGLALLSAEERNPGRTSSFGTGELIKQAMEEGATTIILGIGGSATNDGGIGMAAALGYRFLDEKGETLSPIGGNLSRIRRIDDTDVVFGPLVIKVKVACDVDNPLTGPSGASHVYGLQKGADTPMIERLDAGLQNLAFVIRQQYGKDIEQEAGAGAAGGMGAGAMFFLHAQLVPGTVLVMSQTGFADQLTGIDLVITGEGKIDTQTLRGKLVKGVVDQTVGRGIPVAALCGTLEASPDDILRLGLCFAGSILQRPSTLADAMRESYTALSDAAFHLISLFETARKGYK